MNLKILNHKSYIFKISPLNVIKILVKSEYLFYNFWTYFNYNSFYKFDYKVCDMKLINNY